MKSAWICVVLGIVGTTCGVARADDLATNGSFETEGTGGVGDSAAWTETVSGAPGSLSARELASPNSGSAAHHLVALGADAIGANAAISQSTIGNGLPSLVGGSTVSASYRGKYTLGPGGVGFRELRVLNSAGQIVAQSGLQVITSGTGGAYQTFTMGPVTVPAIGAPPNDAFSAFVEINVAGGAFVGSSAEAYIDDVVITGTVVGGLVTGACCTGTSCSITTQANCAGTYLGNGTSCASNPCVPAATGACCVDGVCSITTQVACTGSYAGDNTTCITNPCPVFDEVAFNGGFEIEGFGGATDALGWNKGVSGGPSSLAERDGTSPRNGAFAMHLIAQGGTGIGGNAVISQNSIGDAGFASLEGGTTVRATFSAKYTLGPGAVGFYALRVLNASGGIVAQAPLGVVTAGTNGQYQTFQTQTVNVPPFGAPPNDVYAAFIELNVAAGAFPESLGEAFIDDVSIQGTFSGAVVGCDTIDFNNNGV
ncbi:MAG TPA: hypothetical protein VK157_13540, partial [Phycisphaerales bacterium]|nr:hypothetical protein [Phycisphaerales bacterium]